MQRPHNEASRELNLGEELLSELEGVNRRGRAEAVGTRDMAAGRRGEVKWVSAGPQVLNRSTFTVWGRSPDPAKARLEPRGRWAHRGTPRERGC